MAFLRFVTTAKYLGFLSLGIGLVTAGYGYQRRFPKESPPTLYAPSTLRFFVLGYNEVVADGLWLRTIQDFDYCETRPSASAAPTEYRCSRGWVFHMIESVTELAPQFRQAYLAGGVMLSVLVNDISGGSAIFDKAVARFPADWQLQFNAGYHALIEEKNPEKASKLLVEAGKNGAPPWVFALAARLQQKSGQLELARSILRDAVELNPQGPGAERIQQRLDDVEAELAKQPK